jgi:hypothetical protein
VKDTPLLGFPSTVTTTFPVVAPEGTRARIEVAVQLIGLALGGVEGDCTSTLGRTKISPVIVTEAPTAPEIGDKAVILGEAAFSWTRTKNYY